MYRRHYLLSFIFVLVFVVGVSSAVVTQYNLTDGDYAVIIFNGTGTAYWTPPGGVTSVSYLVVAGGGSGGGYFGGGGGGGGVLSGSGFAVSGNTTVVVGAGGTLGTNGGNSSFSSLIAIGGGTGAIGGGDTTTPHAAVGGSGGGGGSTAGHTSGAAGTAGQGNTGGNSPGAGWNYASGGGGGAGEAGKAATTTVGGNGGNGTASSITGTSLYYGGGGGGAVGDGAGWVRGLCMFGGGGTGAEGALATGLTILAATPGTDETGGGGGGGGTTVGTNTGKAAGGSGVVIIRYANYVAAFTSNVTTGYPPFYIQFNDTQTVGTPTAWNWSFGDGSYSSTQNATHWYNVTIGNTITSYTVSLNSSTLTAFDWENKTNYVTAFPLNASFNANVTTGEAPLTVGFTDATNNGTPTSWWWNIGGNISTIQNPWYTFSAPGLYTIELNASNQYSWDWENKTYYVNVTANMSTPVAAFAAAPLCANISDTIYFVDFSSGAYVWNWNWSFGDGNYSILRNPTHAYGENGTFNVNLTIYTANGTDYEYKSNYITIPCNATPTPTPTPTPTSSSGTVVSVPRVQSASSANISGLLVVVLCLGGIGFAGIIGYSIFNRRDY